MTCDQVRERLSDHLLATLSEEDSDAVAAHLRGCASCRAESAALADGLAAFASASHDREPPEELAERVREVLHAEWAAAPPSRQTTAARDAPGNPPARGSRLRQDFRRARPAA